MERRAFLLGALAAAASPCVIAQETPPGAADAALREKLATCARIFAMQGLLGLFGHVSAFDPKSRRVLITPGAGVDKARLKGPDMVVIDLSGKVLEGRGRPPIEWPIHTALHAARADALAVAHLHPPQATLFGIARREFAPVTVQGCLLIDGVPLYRDAELVTTIERGQRLAATIGAKPALFMRGHGVVVVGKSLERVLYAALILEDEARKAAQAAALGEVGTIGEEECRAFSTDAEWDARSRRAWSYYAAMESRWDRQPASGMVPFS